MAAQRTIREILVKVATTGSPELKELAQSMSVLNKEISKITASFKFLGGVLAGFAAYFSITEIAGMADSIQLLRNRIGGFIGDADKTQMVMEDIFDAANRTRTSVDSFGEVFSRLGVVLAQSNLQAETLISITETLAKTFQISGANAQEAANASVQFSQALAVGVLRGQDFKSVLSQNAEFGNVLIRSLSKLGDEFANLDRGGLIKLAEQGRLTANLVLQALAEAGLDVDKKFQGMNSTFGQTVTILKNDLKKAIDDLNRSLKLDSAFAKAVDTLVNKFTLLLTVSTVVAVSAIPILIAKFGGLTAIIGKATAALTAFYTAALAFVTTNPFTAVIAGLGIAILLFADSLDNVVDRVKLAVYDIRIAFNSLFLELNRNIFGQQYGKRPEGQLRDRQVRSQNPSIALADLVDDLNKERNAIQKSYDARNKIMRDSSAEQADIAAKQKRIQDDIVKNVKESQFEIAEAEAPRIGFLKELNAQYDKGVITLKQYNAALKGFETGETIDKFLSGQITLEQKNEALFGKRKKRIEEEIKDPRKAYLKALNDEYAKGTVAAETYFDALESFEFATVADGFAKGEVELSKLNDKIRENKIGDLNKQLASGRIGFNQFNNSISQLKLEELNESFQQNKISLLEYERELLKVSDSFNFRGSLRVGLQDSIESLGTISSNIAGSISRTFATLEDALFDFTKTGKFNFKDFAQSVLDDLNRVIIKAAVLVPIQRGILGLLNLDATTSPSTTTEDIPTITPTGPTRIVKGQSAQKVSNSVVVNIVNNTDGRVEQTETTNEDGSRVIDVLITNKVRDAIASGQLDRSFSQAYGLKRRGG